MILCLVNRRLWPCIATSHVLITRGVRLGLLLIQAVNTFDDSTAPEAVAGSAVVWLPRLKAQRSHNCKRNRDLLVKESQVMSSVIDADAPLCACNGVE